MPTAEATAYKLNPCKSTPSGSTVVCVCVCVCGGGGGGGGGVCVWCGVRVVCVES